VDPGLLIRGVGSAKYLPSFCSSASCQRVSLFPIVARLSPVRIFCHVTPPSRLCPFPISLLGFLSCSTVFPLILIGDTEVLGPVPGGLLFVWCPLHVLPSRPTTWIFRSDSSVSPKLLEYPRGLLFDPDDVGVFFILTRSLPYKVMQLQYCLGWTLRRLSAR